MLEINVVIIAIETPLIIGLYKNNKLFESRYIDGQTSETLPIEFNKLLENYKIKKVVFANGPGSFMAIKISYLFLKTVAQIKNIELFGVDGFYFNFNQPIRAINNMAFIKDGKDIIVKKIEDFKSSPFSLPNSFEVEKYSKDIEPLYILPAI